MIRILFFDEVNKIKPGKIVCVDRSLNKIHFAHQEILLFISSLTYTKVENSFGSIHED